MATINGSARADVLRGSNNGDWIDGGDGNDSIDALGGNDFVFGGAGRDTLNGGAGSDYVDGGVGDDLLIYAMGENKGSFDIYNGWTGSDTLRLVFTAAEWARADVKADVARFLAYLPEYNEPLGWIDDPVFLFKAFGLSVVGVNKLEVVVDGKVVNAADAPVVTKDDALAVMEDTGATLDVLANDWVADGVKSVSFTQPKNGKVELVSTNFAAETPSAVVRFTPGDKYQSLAEGETATELFNYTVTDLDGDVKTAAVQVTITGTNDAPTAKATAIKTDEFAGTLTGSIKGHDVDHGATLTYELVDGGGWFSPFSLNEDGSWTYETESWFSDELAAGETRVDTYEVRVTDEHGASTTTTVSFTVVGRNDLPEWDGYSAAINKDKIGRESVEKNGKIVFDDYFYVDDADSHGTFTASVAKPPKGYVGKLTVFGGEDGAIDYRFEVDAAILKGLGEGQTIVQTYQVTIGDGDGGFVTKPLEITLVGDGEDPVTVGLPDTFFYYDQANGKRTAKAEFSYHDDDVDQAHVASVEALGSGYVGGLQATAEPLDGYGNGFVRMNFAAPLADIAGLRYDQLKQAYRVTVTDAAGNKDSLVQVFTLRDDKFLYGGAGGDLLAGDAYERNVLVGGAGGDKLTGGNLADHLFGGDGPALPQYQENSFKGGTWSGRAGVDDELNGGRGADELTGGAGADRFVFGLNEANGDRVTDFSAAAGDKLVFLDWGAGATFTHLDGERWEIATADRSAVNVITLTGVTDLAAGAYAFETTPPSYGIGTAADETNSPDYLNRNVVVGGGGRDYLRGGGQADELYGDNGPGLPDGSANAFNGYANWYADAARDDMLDGGGGADRLTGGAGADTFILDAYGAAGDVIVDFNAAEGDRIEFRYFGAGATFMQVDATHWRVASADGALAAVITLENGATPTPSDYSFFY